MLDRRRVLMLPAAMPLFGPWRATPQLTVAGEIATLWLPGGGVFRCPARRARLIAVLHLRVMAMALLAFAADPPGATQDVLALVDGEGHLRALERLTCHGAGGGGLVTQVAMMPDRLHISLQRHASTKLPSIRTESWTDYLRAEPGALVNAPQRSPLLDSWQHALAAERLQCQALLTAAQTEVLPAQLSLLARPFPA